MDMFSSSPLMESFPSSRFGSPAPSPTRTETDLPIEVDESFNSSMSISCGGDHSPTLPAPLLLSPSASFNKSLPPSPLPTPTTADFLSPTPFNIGKPKRPDPVPIQSYQFGETKGFGLQPISQKRTFGRELSMNTTTAKQKSLGVMMSRTGSKGMMLPPAVPDGKPSSSRPRGGIPMKWSSSNEETSVPRLAFSPAIMRHDTDPEAMSPRSFPSSSEMDIDSPLPTSRRPSAVQASPAFSGAASFSGSPGLGSFFCDSPGAPSALPPAKRRSLVTGSPASPSSPSAKRASYGMREKTASSSAMLFGGNTSRQGNLASRRGGPYKRPTLMAMPPSDHASMDGEAQRSASATSAYPILYGAQKTSLGGTFPKATTAPMRRAFSVCDQPQMGMSTPEADEDESEYENSPSMSIHAEYARRTGQKFAPRVDGSPGFKPMRSSYAASSAMSPSGKGKKQSPYGAGGLPGFGDNEMDGKILPCHKVKEDGLVRITPQTLNHLLDGKYQSQVKRYHILDCRFDYEFAGGHIAGAVNVKSMDALDELLMTASMGLHENGDALPIPSRSGELGDGEQVVLVFHCEFSAKRAPTFAKHLRSRDRMVNNAQYPKIFYPEVYILEGGYSSFYTSHATRCDPQGYVPMDDPRHFERRNSDLHDFRKFARTRSFTYGETQQLQPSLLTGSSRPPLCPPLAFAAASAAVGRRQGPTIAEEEHDHDVDSSPAPGLTGSPGYQASPCPRVVSLGNPPVFGSAKPRQLARMGFARVQSYAGTTVKQ